MENDKEVKPVPYTEPNTDTVNQTVNTDSPENVDELKLDNDNAEAKSSLNTQVSKKKSKYTKFNPRNYSRNTKLICSLVGVLIIVGGLTIILSGGKKSDSKSDEQVATEESKQIKIGAAITLKEGTVQIKSLQGQWEEINNDTILQEKSQIRTVGASSRVVVAFDDGSAVRLDANSEAELEKLNIDNIVVKHIAGYTYNRVMPSETVKYVVVSKDAQYEALGTAFRTTNTGDEQAVEVFDSSVLETIINKTVKTGEKLVVVDESNPDQNGTISKLDIEELKKDAFLAWNIEIDTKDNNFKSKLGIFSDIKSPDVTLSKNDGEVILFEPNASEGTVEISGTTEAGAKVTVISKSQTGANPVEVTIGSDGRFTTPVLTAPIGNSVFEFIVKDRTGNTTIKSLRLTFQKKSQPIAGNATSFVLSGSANNTNSKVELNWTFKGISAPDGVKNVYSKTADPVFGAAGVASTYAETGTTAVIKYEDFVKKDGNGTYYIKSCVYDKATSTCGQYSNQISVVIP